MKTHSDFEKRYLILCDFDGTLFKTSDPSPTGMTVQKAYVQSLDDIFGKGTGELFFSGNGFNGEGPSQIIQTFLSTTNGDFVHKMQNARRVCKEQNGHFPKIIPESQNGEIQWSDEKPELALTQMLIIRKLSYLMGEVGIPDRNGNSWPLPCEGVLNFF